MSCLMALLFALPVKAENPYIPIKANFEIPASETQWTLDIRQANTPEIRCYLWQGTNVFNASGWTPKFMYGKSDSATNMSSITGTITYNVTTQFVTKVTGGVTNISTNFLPTCYASFQATTNSFPYPMDNWYSTVLLSTGSVYMSQASGILNVRRAPEMVAGLLEFAWPTINWQRYTNQFNTYLYGPYRFTNGWTVATNSDGSIFVENSGGATWGSIIGTLSSQTDLQNALTARCLRANNLADLSHAGTARTNLGLGSIALSNNTDYLLSSSAVYWCDGSSPITGHITFSSSNAFDIGTAAMPARHGYFGESSLHVGTSIVSMAAVDYWNAAMASSLTNTYNITNTIAGMTAASVTNGATLGLTALQVESDTMQSVYDRGKVMSGTNGSIIFGDGTARYLNATTADARLAEGTDAFNAVLGAINANITNGFTRAGTNLDLIYLGISSKASDADLLDGLNGSLYVTNNGAATLGLTANANINGGGYYITNALYPVYTTPYQIGFAGTVTVAVDRIWQRYDPTNTTVLVMPAPISGQVGRVSIDINAGANSFTLSNVNLTGTGTNNGTMMFYSGSTGGAWKVQSF